MRESVGQLHARDIHQLHERESQAALARVAGPAPPPAVRARRGGSLSGGSVLRGSLSGGSLSGSSLSGGLLSGGSLSGSSLSDGSLSGSSLSGGCCLAARCLAGLFSGGQLFAFCFLAGRVRVAFWRVVAPRRSVLSAAREQRVTLLY